MRARLRYSVISPRAPRRYAGYVAGLVLAALGASGAVVGGIVADVVTHAAAAGIVAVVSL